MLSTYDLAYLRLLIQESPDFYLEELADEMSTYLGQSKSLIWNTLRWMKDGVYTEAGAFPVEQIFNPYSRWLLPLRCSWPALHLNVTRLHVPHTGCK